MTVTFQQRAAVGTLGVVHGGLLGVAGQSPLHEHSEG